MYNSVVPEKCQVNICVINLMLLYWIKLVFIIQAMRSHLIPIRMVIFQKDNAATTENTMVFLKKLKIK